ncbi:MAG: 4Fe-4S dicluster domain-containing protein [Anaerolineae bacterium]|nr:4Fe-4S dicluster domain-containing protein [Anaerolineae bacterium]
MTPPPSSPWIDRMTCIGCGACISTCPTDALARLDGKPTVTAPNRCTACAACEDGCPVGAIQLPYFIVPNPIWEERIQ